MVVCLERKQAIPLAISNQAPVVTLQLRDTSSVPVRTFDTLAKFLVDITIAKGTVCVVLESVYQYTG